MIVKLVNRFENEVIELDIKSEEDIYIAPKFKEIRAKLKNGEFKKTFRIFQKSANKYNGNKCC